MIISIPLVSAPCTADGKPLPGFVSGSIEMEMAPAITIVDSTATVINEDIKLLPEGVMNKEKVYLVRKLATMPAVVLKETKKRVYLAVAIRELNELTYYWVTRTPECITPRDSHMLVDDLVENLKEG